ncbi:LytTR family transcriptional regulator DNA-binding domain-containing protein [Hyphobacterium sp. CCMP332]|nr:LytTR family transcriptional regulator DNA-binding domain-containing protein [Hyphobacterium sp. CCMP332]
MNNNTLLDKLKQCYHLLSAKERIAHIFIWISGLVLINIPSWDITVGEFHSQDYSLIVPGIYGLLINITLFYGNTCLVYFYIRKNRAEYFKQSSLLFLILCFVEILLDTIFWSAWNQRFEVPIVQSIVLGTFLMNAIFFLLPSFVYAVVLILRNEKPVKEKISIKDGMRNVLVKPKDILFIEADGNYVKFQLKHQKYLERNTLVQVLGKLPSEFIQCHRSYIVNTEQIREIQYSTIQIGDFTVPIGRSYRKTLRILN